MTKKKTTKGKTIAPGPQPSGQRLDETRAVKK